MNIMESHKEFISKPEIQFWFPIFAMIVSITIWGMTLRQDIALMRKDLDFEEGKVQARIDYTDPIITDYKTFKEDSQHKFTVIGQRLDLNW